MKLAFPEVSNFSDLFVATKPYKGRRVLLELKDRFCGIGPEEPLTINSYCSVGFDSLDVEPSKAVLDYLTEHLVVAGDVSFKVVHRRGGESLVLAHYSQILGERWLAIVQTETIPQEEET